MFARGTAHTIQFLVFVKHVGFCYVPGLVSAIPQLKGTDVLPVDGEVTGNRHTEKYPHILKNILGQGAVKHRRAAWARSSENLPEAGRVRRGNGSREGRSVARADA